MTERQKRGRKAIPQDQRRKQITLYIESAVIDQFGGPDDLRRWLLWKITEHQERKLINAEIKSGI
jgi:hypothetical protein